MLLLLPQAALAWTTIYGTPTDDGWSTLVKDEPDSFITLHNPGPWFTENFVITRFSDAGVKLWSKTYSSERLIGIGTILKTPDRGYLLSGTSVSPDASPYRVVLIKLRQDFSVEWARYYNRTSRTSDSGATVRIHGENYLVTASSEDGDTRRDVWLFEIDRSGNVLWQTLIASRSIEDIYLVRFLDDGGFLAAGTLEVGFDDLFNAWFAGFSSKGILLWQKIYGGAKSFVPSSLEPLPSGNYLVSGQTRARGGGRIGTWLAEITPKAELRWQKVISSGGFWDALNLIPSRHPEQYYLLGSTGVLDDHGNSKIYGTLAAIDLKGNLLWQNHYSKGNETYLTEMVPLKGSSNYLVNSTTLRWNGSKGADEWLFTVDSHGEGSCNEVSSTAELVTEAAGAPLASKRKPTRRGQRLTSTTVVTDFTLTLHRVGPGVRNRCP